jgi:hypothetical protein
MEYYNIKQNVCVKGGPLKVLGKPAGPSLDWLKGQRLDGISKNKVYEFTSYEDYSEEGEIPFLGALIQNNYTLFHYKFREALDQFGIDNIEYYKTKIHEKVSDRIIESYLLVNILGLYDCPHIPKAVENSLSISEEIFDSKNIFRIDDKVLNPIMISGDLKSFLKENKILVGVNVKDTSEGFDF